MPSDVTQMKARKDKGEKRKAARWQMRTESERVTSEELRRVIVKERETMNRMPIDD